MAPTRGFISAASAILFTTGLVKLVSAGGEVKSLSLPDPVLYLSNRQVFLWVGVTELMLASYLILGRLPYLKLIALAWLTTNFVAYRLALWWGNASKPCGCLGNALDWWPWLKLHQDGVMKCLLAFMLMGAYGFLWHEWRLGKGKETLAGRQTG